jgi:hypothetical protein
MPEVTTKTLPTCSESLAFIEQRPSQRLRDVACFHQVLKLASLGRTALPS